VPFVKIVEGFGKIVDDFEKNNPGLSNFYSLYSKNVVSLVIFAKGFAKITGSFTKNVSRRVKNVTAPAKQAIRIFCNNQGSFALAKLNYCSKL
jgi:hypothetical protein